MKNKLFLASATLLTALSLTGVASADTTRDQIEAEGNQQIQSYWNEYQQALQDRQNAWEQSHGDIYTPAWQDANAHAGAAYREWLEARTALGDRLHAYDVEQWEKESNQPSNQTPVDDSQVPEENSHALNTQGSQAAVPTSQSATPASQAKLSSQPATQELTQQASVADPASQPITQSTAQKPQQIQPVTTTQSSQISAEQPQTEVTKTDQPQTKASAVQFNQSANVEAKSTTHNPQQATTSRTSAKPADLSSQVKKPAQSNTVQNDQQTKLPQTGNSNLLTVVGILLFALLGILIGVWKFFDARRGGKR